MESPTRKHRIILGPPGSGKTQVMLHRAQHLQRLGLRKYHLFTFNNTLKDYISDAVKFLDLEPEAVSTADQLFHALYLQHINRRILWNKETKTPDFSRVRAELLQALQDQRIPAPMYDFALVDEAQDLTATTLRIISLLAKHVTVFMDGKQQLYGEGTTEREAAQALGVTERRMHLLEAYRVSPYLATLASTFIMDPDEQRTFRKQVRTEQLERQTPVLFLADDAAGETARLTQVVASRVGQGERVAVLFPTVRQVRGFSNAFKEAGIPFEVSHPGGNLPALDFRSDLPKLMTYQAAKGMTFDSVFLPRLIPRYFTNMQVQQMMFVGLTRATRWAFLSTVKDRHLPELSSLLAGTAELAVQFQEAKPATPSQPAPHDEDEEMSLFY
ncbi:AAA family ATPase [Deinococcus aquaticus]|uniref:AAA family ATPase n=1 Tax=Deinococcus aquaticus TaxID=328692 RepID=UPI003F46BE1A